MDKNNEDAGRLSLGSVSSGVAAAGKPPLGGSMSAFRTSMVMAAVTILVIVSSLLIAQPPHVAGVASSEEGTRVASASNMAAPTGKVTHVDVRVNGFSFEPNRIELPSGNDLHITLTNDGDQSHDLVFEGAFGRVSTGQVPPGESADLTLPGVMKEMEGWCTLPGHRSNGMTLQVVPSGEGSSSGAANKGHAHGHSEHVSGTEEVMVPTMDQLMSYNATVAPYPAETKMLTTPSGTEHRLTLRAQETTQTLADGHSRTLWTFNGDSPGPLIRVKVGDTVRLTLINEGTMGHSIDFHAGDVSPDAPMRTIEPGQSLEYVFTARRAGIWMYHCSTHPMSLHIAAGMHGAVIVEPEDLSAVDQEFALVAAEVFPDSRNGIASMDRIASMNPDLTAFNGRPHQYVTHPLHVKVGQKVRMWVLNVGPNIGTAFHVVGTQFDTVWTEGSYLIRDGVGRVDPSQADGSIPKSGGAQVMPLLAAQGGFVEFTPVEPGTYTFVNHVMSLAEKGQRGKIIVSP